MSRVSHMHSDEANRFAGEMSLALDIAKNLDVFCLSSRRHLGLGQGEIYILRRWNSHTPCLHDNAPGGGCFLRWGGRGTVVDPGYTFIRNFKETGYGLDDIHMVIATHDHSDHCQDLGPLISLFRQYNKWRVDRGHSKRAWDMVVSHGVAHQLSSLLHNPDNRDVIHWETVVPPKTIRRIRSAVEAAGGDPATQSNLIRHEYQYDLKMLPTNHKEYLHESEHTAMGVRFKMQPDGKVIVISGDTAINSAPTGTSGRQLAGQYKGADLLILHVGSMERPAQLKLDEHLGLRGVVEILRCLSNAPPKCVVLTEWGYEFSKVGRNGRTRFTQLVVDELSRLNCNAYYVPFPNNTRREDQTPIVPADENLQLRLPDFAVWSGNDFFGLDDLLVTEDDIRFSYKQQ